MASLISSSPSFFASAASSQGGGGTFLKRALRRNIGSVMSSPPLALTKPARFALLSMYRTPYRPHRREMPCPCFHRTTNMDVLGKGYLTPFSATVPNLVQTLCPIRPNVLWAGDFTYLPWRNGFLYLATVMDVYTREIVGWHLSTRHTTALIIAAFRDAVQRAEAPPRIFHS